MFCPRLHHFTRLMNDGTIGKCGHMVYGKGFQSFEEMEKSDWVSKIKNKMESGIWPKECRRCRVDEESKGTSVRTNSIDRHRLLAPLKQDYIIVGGVLDNTCNSACQSCNSSLSTKIGSLESKKYIRTNNYTKFKDIPQDRILEIDVSGGEPTASKNYKKLLRELPRNVKIVRMNTNASRMIPELEHILRKGITVIVTLSFDGIEKVHDYTRWPIGWTAYEKTLDAYIDLRARYKLLHLDMWSTISCFNVEILPDLIKYAGEKKIPHDWSFLDSPRVMNVRFKNKFTTRAKQVAPHAVAVDRDNDNDLRRFIEVQDKLRGIQIKDYFDFL